MCAQQLLSILRITLYKLVIAYYIKTATSIQYVYISTSIRARARVRAERGGMLTSRAQSAARRSAQADDVVMAL